MNGDVRFTNKYFLPFKRSVAPNGKLAGTKSEPLFQVFLCEREGLIQARVQNSGKGPRRPVFQDKTYRHGDLVRV